MVKVRTDVVDKMFIMMLLFVVLILCPITFAEEVVDAPKDDAVLQPCATKYGCEELGFFYDAVTDTWRFKNSLKRLLVVYRNDRTSEDYYVEEQYKSILISAILFIACAIVCVVSACIYCCRISHTDRTLKKHVKAVEKKLKKDSNSMKVALKHAQLPAISESCSVPVEPAGVMVV